MMVKAKSIENLSQDLIVLLACFTLGGAKENIHTEEIAYKSFLLKSSDFSWQIEKYKRYPDITKVRKSLDRAKKYRWMIGSYSYNLLKDGWKLSSLGIKECDNIKHLLKLKKVKTTIQRLDKKKIKFFISNNYYKKFLKNKEIDINTFELADMLGSSPGNAQHIRSKFYELKSLSELSKNKDINIFLSYLENKFPNLLNEKLLQEQSMASRKKISNIK